MLRSLFAATMVSLIVGLIITIGIGSLFGTVAIVSSFVFDEDLMMLIASIAWGIELIFMTTFCMHYF